jgi:hypothetical protein
VPLTRSTGKQIQSLIGSIYKAESTTACISISSGHPLQYVGDEPLLNETETDMEKQVFPTEVHVKYLRSVCPRYRSLSPIATLSRVYFDSFFKF